jgi:DNA-binding NarL/FixJ family response regulator
VQPPASQRTRRSTSRWSARRQTACRTRRRRDAAPRCRPHGHPDAQPGRDRGDAQDRPGDGSPRILILTTFDLDDYVYEALRAGASGFLLKDARAEELRQAVRMVAAGDALLSPAITRRLIESYTRRPPSTVHPAPLAELTPRELEVLRLVARGLSNADIARALFVGDATVKTHVARVFSKLDLHDRAQAVVLAYESGLVQPGGG